MTLRIDGFLTRSVLLMTVLCLVLAACGSGGAASGDDAEEAVGTGGDSAEEGDGEPWTVGAVYPITGSVAGFGAQQSNGLRIAAQLVNEDGGINGHPVEVELVDGPDSEAVVSAVQGLVDQDIPLIFGTASSGFSLAASPVAERAGVVYVETGATATELTEREFEYFFRTRANFAIYSEQSVALANEVVAERLGKDPSELTAAILHDDGPTGTDIAANVPIAAEAAGSPEIITKDGYSPTDTKDFTSIILKYKELNPDVIFWMAFPADAILFWRQAKQLGYTPPAAIAYLSGPGTPDFQEAIGPDDSNGILVLDAPLTIDQASVTPEAVEVRDRFEAAYAEEFPEESFTGNAVVGFIGGWILFKHVLPNVEEFTSEAIREEMLAADVPTGSLFTGWGVEFENGQNMRAFPVALEWQAGELVTVWPEELAIGEATHLPIQGSSPSS